MSEIVTPELRTLYTRAAPSTTVRVGDRNFTTVRETRSGISVASLSELTPAEREALKQIDPTSEFRAAEPVPIDNEVRELDALFCRSGTEGIDSYGWAYDSNWLDDRAGAWFLGRGHDWREYPIGAGGCEKRGGRTVEFHLVGMLRDSAENDPIIRAFLRLYNQALEYNVSLEVSMGFFVREWREASEAEMEDGIWIYILKGDLVEVSFVFRGAVFNTSLELRGSSEEGIVRTSEISEHSDISGSASESATISTSDHFARGDERLRMSIHRQRMRS